MEIVVALAVAECYVIHSTDEGWPPNEKDILLERIGRIRTQFRLAGPAPAYLPPNSLNENDVRDRADTLDTIRRDIAGLDFPQLKELNLNCDQALFMEALPNTLRNETISFQVFIRKAKNQSIKRLIDILATEKTALVPCMDMIERLEREVDRYFENELIKELEHYSLFEHINMEKMTPHFLKIAKSSKSDNKLSDIVMYMGNLFEMTVYVGTI